MRYLLGLCIFLTAIPVDAQYTQMGTRPNEALPNPISLSNCRGVRIIEWHGNIKSPAIQVIDETCKLATRHFESYAVARGFDIPLNFSYQFIWSLAILPYDTDYRHLNDVKFRFFSRYPKYYPDGSVYMMPGYTSYINRETFIFNEILTSSGRPNERFITILAHEFAHALSFHYGIFAGFKGNNRVAAEENFAVGFTEYLGLGR